ncbi:TPA: tail fiber assembly protein [Salmonella enterica subsp. enterica serovar Panama]
MMTYQYSALTNMFYPESELDVYKSKGSAPDDLKPVSDDDAYEFMGLPPDGKMRGANVEGKPCWVEIPPPTHEQLVAAAEQQKTALLAEATAVIAPLADAQAGGYIDVADVPRLAEWQRYRYKLTKVDTSTAPAIILPPKPEV